MRMKRVAVDLFSGLIIPVAFFPGWAENVIQWLPFQAISYLPSKLFSGGTTGTAIQHVFEIQIAWFLLLILPIYWIWRRARHRLFVQGG